ncbi:MAG: aminotransferase class V-fold PLP-dependent enzyme [Anaerolineales bacterium]|nr:aminotransferase class V-fold PLP-dependent enzyme [Anaerolineales bacterium]
MAEHLESRSQETLDPEDWGSVRELGHRMIDDMLDYLETVAERPAWQPAPEQVKAHFNSPAPQEPQNRDQVYQEFLEFVHPYPIGNVHPRFWGWVFGTGTVMGALAEFLAGAMNTNAGDIDHHSANHVEKQVLAWIKEMLGFPATASGLLTSGCSAANLVGLNVARNAMASYDLRNEGVNASGSKMVMYASQEIHSSIQKAVEILGLGTESLRWMPVNENFEIDLQALQVAIDEDRERGLNPFCVVGAAGTTNTGAVDDLNSLADLCEREQLWLHIDGAFGAWAALAPNAREKVSGMARADSLALDLHKWMYMQYEIGCIFVRHPEHHKETFFLRPDYLARVEGGRGMTSGDLPWLTDYGYQLSRNFRALKAWISIKENGSLKYGRIIQQNIDQAHYLAQLVKEHRSLELMAPVPLNVVCFRFIHPELDDGGHDMLNQKILAELQEGGLAVLSGTRINGKFALHVAHTNHRSRWEDFDLLVREVVRLGEQLIINEGGAIE